MAGRLIGRDAETAQLYDAMTLAAQGEPQLVLVAGDAGIGKTCLVSRSRLSARRSLGFATATGHCLDIEAAMSFAPVIEAPRTLLSEAPTSTDALTLVACARCWTRTLRSRIRSGCSTTCGSPSSRRPPTGLSCWSSRTCTGPTGRPRTSSALARTAQGSLLLVITVRDDELHRRHPFRTDPCRAGPPGNRPTGRASSRWSRDIALLVRDRSGIEGSSESVRFDPRTVRGQPVVRRGAGRRRSGRRCRGTSQTCSSPASRGSRARRRVWSAPLRSTDPVLDTELLTAVTGLTPTTLEKLTRQAVDEHVLHLRGPSSSSGTGCCAKRCTTTCSPDERIENPCGIRRGPSVSGGWRRGNPARPQPPGLPLVPGTRDPPHARPPRCEPVRPRGTSEPRSRSRISIARVAVGPGSRTRARRRRAKPDLLLLLARAHAENERRDLFGGCLAREALAARARRRPARRQPGLRRHSASDCSPPTMDRRGRGAAPGSGVRRDEPVRELAQGLDA